MLSSSKSKGKSRAYNADDYGSEFEPDSEVDKKKAKRSDLATKEHPVCEHKPSKSTYVDEWSKDEARYMRHHYVSTNAYARHKELVNNYLQYYGGKMSDFQQNSERKTDRDIIREHHQFVWEDEDDAASWDKRLAKKYYDKLYKEYCLADLSRYKENKIAMRWRVENEVISGKGQFVCGNKKCNEDKELKSWEVNFAYMEQQVKKNCLVKLRLCPQCSAKLNYSHTRREITQEIKELRSQAATEGGSSSSSKRKITSESQLAGIIEELLP